MDVCGARLGLGLFWGERNPAIRIGGFDGLFRFWHSVAILTQDEFFHIAASGQNSGFTL